MRFDGSCISDSGDRITLAASNIPDWDVNDGNTHTFARSQDDDRLSFSHTRVYDVSSGVNNFYAVGQRWVCDDGNAFASVYGILTVIFFPEGQDAILASHGFYFSGNVEGGPVTMDTVKINPTVSGTAVVRFNGTSEIDEGDKVFLAASDTSNWGVYDGNAFIEVDDASICLGYSPFSHSRVYHIDPGQHTFYAVAENFVETDGSGDIYLYASLTVEFYPDSSGIGVYFNGVSHDNIDLTNGPTNLSELSVHTNKNGNAMVIFDGTCVNDSGDQIILAASDMLSWGTENGSVSVEALNNDINENSFSHTRVYPITTTTNYYAVGQNYNETDGNGIASIYGSFIAIFFPEVIDNIKQTSIEKPKLIFFPNPVTTSTMISFTLKQTEDVSVKIYDVTGRLIQTLSDVTMFSGNHQLVWNTENEDEGIYILRMETKNYYITEKLIVQK